MSKIRITAITDKLKERNLKFPEDLELFNDRIFVRKIDEIAKRAVVTAIVSKCAYDLFETEDIEKTQKEFIEVLNKFGLEQELFADEKAVLYNEYDEDLCNGVCWQYEAANALLWALGIIESIDDAVLPDNIYDALCDIYNKVTNYASFDAFLKDCTLRSEENLADAYQLYWHYHWNTVDGMLFGTMPESISYDVVFERRRALQWLVYSDESDNGDWDISMDT